jgi:hypothetical protein
MNSGTEKKTELVAGNRQPNSVKANKLTTDYRFIIYGRDRAGNYYRSEVFSSEIPLILSTEIIAYSPGVAVTNSSTMTISFVSDEPTATFECTLNDGTPVPCVSPVTYDGLADGRYTFWVNAVKGSQGDEEGASHSWTVDTVPPFITWIAATTTTTTIQIDWVTSEPATAYFEWGSIPYLKILFLKLVIISRTAASC